MKGKIAISIASALIASNAAWAGSQLESARSTCGVINCAGMTIRGIHQPSEPFVIQIFAREGECLRLDVSEQTGDLAMAVEGPTVYINGFSDDRVADDLRPLIIQDPMPSTGWYTIVISQVDAVTTTARFELEYGRYQSGNINCPASATTGAQMLSPLSDIPAKAAKPAMRAPVSEDQHE